LHDRCPRQRLREPRLLCASSEQASFKRINRAIESAIGEIEIHIGDPAPRTHKH
jgi:hypothetical protein